MKYLNIIIKLTLKPTKEYLLKIKHYFQYYKISHQIGNFSDHSGEFSIINNNCEDYGKSGNINFGAYKLSI